MCSTLSMTLIVLSFSLSFSDKNILRSFELAAIKSRKRIIKTSQVQKLNYYFLMQLLHFAVKQNFRYNIDEL